MLNPNLNPSEDDQDATKYHMFILQIDDLIESKPQLLP